MSFRLKGRMLCNGATLSGMVGPGDTIWIVNTELLGGSSRSASSDHDSNFKKMPNATFDEPDAL